MNLQRFNQGFAGSVAIPKFISQFFNLSLFVFFLSQLSSLAFQIMWEFIQYALQELTAKQPFASPSSSENHFLHDQTIGNNIVQNQMYAFVFNFFVEIPLVKSLHKGIDGSVRVLQAANQKLTLSNPSLFDRRVILHISNWKISIKNFIKPFLSAGNTYFITVFFNLVVEIDLFCSFFAILCTNNLDFDDLSDVFVEYFKRGLFYNCFRLI